MGPNGDTRAFTPPKVLNRPGRAFLAWGGAKSFAERSFLDEGSGPV